MGIEQVKKLSSVKSGNFTLIVQEIKPTSYFKKGVILHYSKFYNSLRISQECHFYSLKCFQIEYKPTGNLELVGTDVAWDLIISQYWKQLFVVHCLTTFICFDGTVLNTRNTVILVFFELYNLLKYCVPGRYFM